MIYALKNVIFLPFENCDWQIIYTLNLENANNHTKLRLPLSQAPQMTDKGVLYQKMVPRYHWPLSKNVMLLTQSARFNPKWTLSGPTKCSPGLFYKICQNNNPIF